MYGGIEVDKRQSNIELFRIFTMLLIIAHHYVYHSGIFENFSNYGFYKSIYFFTAGAWGKTGINCFVLITGYFMCTQNTSIKKWLKFIAEILFYNIIIYAIFVISGYCEFSIKELFDAVLFIRTPNYITCYILFYLFIPFINILIDNISEKQHMILIICSVSVFSVLPSLALSNLSMNYVTWFPTIYLIGAYLRLYPKKIFSNWILWIMITVITMVLSIIIAILKSKLVNFTHYFLLEDSNAINATIVSVFLFITFSNLPINNNRFINLFAKSTFGVLLIHDNPILRKWLWGDVFHCLEVYNSSFAYIHIVISVISIFIVCTLIDILREELFVHIFEKKLK